MKDPDKLTIYDTRHYPVRPHVGIGVLLVRDENLLLVKRKYDPDAGMWSIPGGHLELGEKVKHAAVRECEEETGLKTKVTKLAGIIDKVMKDDEGRIEFHYVLINYFVEQVAGDLDQPPKAADDALATKFVPFSELKDYNLTKSLIELLRVLKIGFD
ncbi:MAG: NUDIX hydrolase [Promethearchaeia archaeon]